MLPYFVANDERTPFPLRFDAPCPDLVHLRAIRTDHREGLNHDQAARFNPHPLSTLPT